MLNKRKNNSIWIIGFLFPALIIYVSLMLIPVFQSIFMSFFSWNGIARSPMKFVKLANYVKIFQDLRFWHSLTNVLWFIASGLIVQFPLAFIMAHITTYFKRSKGIFKTIYFLPVVLPITAVGLIWIYILYPDGGLVPQIMEFFKLPEINFLGDPKVAMKSIVLVSAWIYAGFNMLILAVGLVSIPHELYESAIMDGAGTLRKLFSITLPMMKESIKIYMIMMVTGSLRHFDLVFVMTGGGPAHSTEVPATLLYNEAFKYRHFGPGNAIGVFILVVGLLLSYVLNKTLNQEAA